MPKTPSPQRKRYLLPLNTASSTSPSASPLKPKLPSRLTPTPSPPLLYPNLTSKRLYEGECGRLVLIEGKGKIGSGLVIILKESYEIGRDSECDYVISSPNVSSHHAKIYSLTSDLLETFIIYSDISSNGTLYNQRRLCKASVMLNNGDKLEIGGEVFEFRGGGGGGVEKEKEEVGNYWVWNRKIGSGANAIVHLAFNTNSLRQVACKKIRSELLLVTSNGGGKRGMMLESIKREVEILRGMRHHNVNTVEDVVVLGSNIYIFLDLVSGGDLFTYLADRSSLVAPEAKFILYQIWLALIYLHEEKNISHRDLKLENVLLASNGPYPKILLADFGQARFVEKDFESMTGTVTYMAPEVLNRFTRRGGYDGKRADIWATGIILVYLLTGQHPFETYHQTQNDSPSLTIFGETGLEIFSQKDSITASNIVDKEFLPHLPGREEKKFGSDDKEAREMIYKLLNHEPGKRCTAKEAIGKERWILKSKRELERLYEDRVLGR